ncbi:MAG: hypothetical protein ACI4J1_00420 [Ruminiclostridium sp.]
MSEQVTVDRLNVIISANKAEFDKKINEVSKELSEMKNRTEQASAATLGAFKSLASGLSALGIGAMIKNAVSLAGDLEQNIGGSQSVFKEYSSVIRQTAENAALSLGLSESKYLATANKMGALFQGAGFSAAKSADMTTQAMQRAADVASIMGISVDSAMEAVAGMAKGNFTMMDNLGVAINDTNLQLYAQEKGLGKLETTQQKVNAAMQMFIDKTDYAAGNYAKENDTYSGALTTLKAEFENFAAEAGTALLPLAQSILPVATQLLNELKPAIVYAAEAIGGLGSVVTDISERVNNAEPGTKTALKIALGMAVAIPAVTVATKALAAGKALYSGVLSILIPKQLTFASALKATMGWIGIIVGALALLGIASNNGAESVGDSSETLEKENEAAKSAAKGIDDVSESTDNLTDSVKRATAGFDEINKLGGGTSTFASTIVSGEDVENAEEYSKLLDDIKSGLGDTNLDTSIDMGVGLNLDFSPDTIVSGIMQAITGCDDEQAKALTDALFDGIFNGQWDEFWKLWNESAQIKGKQILHALVTVITGETDTTIIDNALEKFFGDLFGLNWSEFWKNWAQGSKTSKANDMMQGLFMMVTSLGGADQEKIAKAFNDFLDAVLTGTWDKFFKSFQDAVNSKWYNFWNLIGRPFDYYKMFTGVEFDYLNGTPHMPNIPKIGAYASGGFPDYGDIFIANERGPEMVGTIGGRTAVVNNSQIETAIENAIARGFAKAGNGQPVEIHVYTELDGEIIGESVTEYQSNRTRRDNGYKK